jgi:putative SOS response-associated peptidase YedK
VIDFGWGNPVTMCGRFTLRLSPSELRRIFDVLRAPEWTPRFNIDPTQDVVAVRRVNQDRQLALLRWGLIPSWAREERIGARLINAQSETVHEKPSFRSAFKERRCLVVADGFFEWKQEGKKKQPYYFRLKDERPFAFAGLWEKWGAIESCTILTTTPNELVLPLHNRMPVILAPNDYDLWLDQSVTAREQLQHLFEPYPPDEMVADPVNPIVNNVRNNGQQCVENSRTN